MRRTVVEDAGRSSRRAMARPGGGAALTAAAFLLAIGAAAAAGGAGGTAAGAPTRDDLDAARRRLARMESEYALAQTRKPYLVLDSGGRILMIRLMGMTVREIPILGIEASGLLPSGEAAEGAAPLRVAGIVTLKEKEDDPRLTPLSAEQIEAGADDENAADALPPPTPSEFRLFFRQSLLVPVEGGATEGSLGGFWSGLRSRWTRLVGSEERPEERDAKLSLTIRLEHDAAQELYRLLLPGLRILVLPPPGLVLPDLGQELPKSLRPGRAPAPPQAGPPQPAPGVPFRIPPPVEAEGPAGEPAAPVPVEEQPPRDEGAAGEPTPVPAQRLDAPPGAGDRDAHPEEEPPAGAPPHDGAHSSADPQPTPDQGPPPSPGSPRSR